MPEELSQFRHRERSESTSRTEQTGRAAYREYGSVEDVLKKDREQTELPLELEIRVSEAIRREPPQPDSWWRRWLRGGQGGSAK